MVDRKGSPVLNGGDLFFTNFGRESWWSLVRGMESRQIITTSAEVTLNGGLVRESPQNPLNSGLGIILICPDGMAKEKDWLLRKPDT